MSTTETDAVIAAEAEPWDSDEFWAAKADLTRTESSYRDLVTRFLLHPCIEMMVLDGYRPQDVRQLALEWAHISTTDDTRIGYTRNASDLLSERKLVTSVGKYLARHWPHVPDHIRRDIQATFVPDRREIVRTAPEMIRAVENGPRSCMGSIHGSIRFTAVHKEMMNQWFADPVNNPEPPWALHPYSCYRPDLGWSMAVRHACQPDKSWRIDGRALILSRPNEKPVFVRTYKRNMSDPVSGWSETDFALQGWLTRSGYEKVDMWPDGALMHIPPLREGGTDRCVPYIDGGSRMLTLDLEAGVDLARFDSASGKVGSYQCETTTGYAAANVLKVKRSHPSLEDFAEENGYDEDECSICEDCHDPYHQDDGRTVGRDEDRYVCESCCDNSYTWVRGSSRWSGYREYYVESDNSAYLESSDYSVDADNLPDGVVCTEDGDYAERDDCVYVDCVGYFLSDDDAVVCDVDGEWRMRDDCVTVEDREGYVYASDAYKSADGTWFYCSDARDEYDAEESDKPNETNEEETEVLE